MGDHLSRASRKARHIAAPPPRRRLPGRRRPVVDDRGHAQVLTDEASRGSGPWTGTPRATAPRNTRCGSALRIEIDRFLSAGL